MNHRNVINDDVKKLEMVGNIKNESPRPYRKYSKEIQSEGNDLIRVSSPRKYYQKAIKKEIDER